MEIFITILIVILFIWFAWKYLLPENVKDYVNDENIDGALVGGASLKAESFLQMIDNLLE